MQRVLMIAYHFPPLAGSSGVQRTLRFVQQLPRHGWEPIVLTAHPRAYANSSDDLLAEIPAGAVVKRAFALDTARHLSLRGRYPARWALPDRWASWRFDAVRHGLRLVRELQPEVLWSTYPIATAHRIGAELQAATGLPWVADFRDPMVQGAYPACARTRAAYLAIEQRAATSASACVFTTPGAARLYHERYRDGRARTAVIENGYDESSFANLPLPPGGARDSSALVLLHSGAIYPSERDPTALFQALSALRDGGVAPAQLRIRFRAAVHDEVLDELAARHGVAEYIETAPPLPYREALAEMTAAGALLVLQAANCNEQIPAKLYEYIRAGRPLVGLTDAAGDTAATLRASGAHYHAPLDDPASIAATLKRLLADHRAGTVRLPDRAAARSCSREARTVELAKLLADCAASLRSLRDAPVPAPALDRQTL